MHVWLLWATAGIWVAFIVYWSSAPGFAQKAEAAPAGKRPRISVQFKRPAGAATEPAAAAVRRSGESAGSRSVHQLLLWSALFMALLPWFAPLDRRWLPDAPWLAPLGLGVQLAFAAFYLWSRRHLGRHWSGAIRTTSDHELVRSGPYRLLRHPMYTAMLGMFLGTALVWGQWHALIALVICVAAYWRKIRLEEPHLRERFGAAYEGYQRESWALIPGLI